MFPGGQGTRASAVRAEEDDVGENGRVTRTVSQWGMKKTKESKSNENE